MKSEAAAATFVAFVCLSRSLVEGFLSTGPTQLQSSSRHLPTVIPTDTLPAYPITTSLSSWLANDPTPGLSHALTHASTYLATIDSDIANIPDDEFGKVFAGGGAIIFGSILSTIFVGFMVEKGGGYADLVAETYADQDFGDDGESFLDSLKLSPDQKEETKEMVQAFREKKMKKAGTWTGEDEAKKQQQMEEKDMFSDYD